MGWCNLRVDYLIGPGAWHRMALLFAIVLPDRAPGCLSVRFNQLGRARRISIGLGRGVAMRVSDSLMYCAMHRSIWCQELRMCVYSHMWALAGVARLLRRMQEALQHQGARDNCTAPADSTKSAGVVFHALCLVQFHTQGVPPSTDELGLE